MKKLNFASRPDLWAFAIILATTLARFAFVATGQLDLVQDEAQYWDWSRTLQLSYYSKGPLIACINWVGTHIFGDTLLGVRSGAVFFSALTQTLFYVGISRLLKRPVAALWSLVILNTAPLFLAGSILMTTDSPLLSFWTGAFLCLYAASKGEYGNWPFWGLGVCLVFGLLAKYNMIAFVPVAICFGAAMHYHKLLRPGFWPRLLLALGVGSSLGLFPIILWNMQTDWVGFKHVGYLGGVAGVNAARFIRFDRFPDFIGSQIALLTPWWFVFLIQGGVIAVRTILRKPATDIGLDLRQSWWLALGFWPAWGYFVLWSFHTKVHPNWPAVSYVAGLIIGALAWDRFWSVSTSRWARYKMCWPVIGAVIFVLLHFQNWMPDEISPETQATLTRVVRSVGIDMEIPRDVNPALRLKGWSDLGRRIDEMKHADFPDPAQVFVFSNSYDMTSALSFAVPGQERAFCVNTGRRLAQYDFWPGPQKLVGWNAVYVLKDWKRTMEPEVAALFERIGPRIEYQTLHKGRPARQFVIYACYGYNGGWPAPKYEDY